MTQLRVTIDNFDGSVSYSGLHLWGLHSGAQIQSLTPEEAVYSGLTDWQPLIDSLATKHTGFTFEVIT